MVEVVVGMLEASAVAVAILVALPATPSQLTKKLTLQRTEVTTGREGWLLGRRSLLGLGVVRR